MKRECQGLCVGILNGWLASADIDVHSTAVGGVLQYTVLHFYFQVGLASLDAVPLPLQYGERPVFGFGEKVLFRLYSSDQFNNFRETVWSVNAPLEMKVYIHFVFT